MAVRTVSRRGPRRAARPTAASPALLAAAFLALLPSPSAAQDGNGAAAFPFAALEARSIGPAGMSGRVTAVDVDPTDRNTIFVGSATGGLWRSPDGGLTWRPVFDDQPVLGVGAVAVSPANPDQVWVGTGEGNPRNSAGVGYGIFRSLDGGESWEHLGLESSERIHRVVPHPRDPDVVFVGAMGPVWSDGGERGVYRTTDGGATWQRVLHVDERTGVADLVMDPTNPERLLAAMWQYRRWPWFAESGGPGSGLWITHDGGDTWDRISAENGLPAGELGRIGLAIAPSDPDVVYALVEAERSELLRSEDGGRTWRTVSDRPGIAPRPFYYADLRVDPGNENRIYSLHGAIQVSEDAGRTWRTVVPSSIIHGDVHELWIDPHDGRHLIVGNDGGIGISRDRGEHWRFVENLPLAQFYHVSVDLDVPFNVYGGLQDNGSWYGPSTVWESRGIMNAHWRRVGGGDGFSVLNDFSDPRYGYSMSQQGRLMRFDKVTGRRHGIQPVHPEGVPLRFNWNAGLAVDPHDSTTIYLGSQFVHRTRDHGASWEILSPDLTTDDPAKQRQGESGGLTIDATGAENHTTILTIAPSPLEPGVIWVGTDDGNLQLTRDDGATWTEVGGAVPDVPDSTWIPHVEASRHDPARAYVVWDDHRRGDWTTWAYRTDDFGGSWTRLATDGVFGFAHVIREDPVVPDLLFLGTEFGLQVSLDGGDSWTAWEGDLPPAPVRDLVIHPRDGDLVVGTHGRGVYVVDDIRPLRELASDPALRERSVHAFGPPPAILRETAEAIGYRSVGHAMFFGEMRPYGALLSYHIGARADEVSLEVLDETGTPVRTLEGPTTRGLHRVVWNLRMEGSAEDGFGSSGPEVVPGTYRVVVRADGAEDEASLRVLPDPREEGTPEGRRARLAAVREMGTWLAWTRRAQERLGEAEEAVETVLADLGPGESALREEGRTVLDTLRALEGRLFTGPECQGICGRGETVAATVRAPYGALNSGRGAPTENERLAMEQAAEALDRLLQAVNAALAGPVSSFGERLEAEGYSPLPDAAPLEGPAG